MTTLPIQFTDTFAALFAALPHQDVAAVDSMLDELECGHDQPQMRGILRIGAHTLFATPRIHAPGAIYRVTWRYDDRDDPTAIVCITVAGVET